MASYIFQQLAKDASTEGISASTRQRDARTWFRDAAQKITSVNRNRLMNDKENLKPAIMESDIGAMFMFFYDPKHKAKLPYYDTFPLIFPIELKNDGFLGINLHYLPPMLRAKLMDALYQTITDTKYNDKTRLQISYDTLSSASKYRYFKPCLKRYLWGHVKSNYLNIPTSMWDAALMLPIAQFQKARPETVWNFSKEIINAR